MSQKDFALSVHADYGRDRLVFARMQSPKLRGLAWESRAKPLRPWSHYLLWAAGAVALIAAVIGAVGL